jgi:hypothetical protein
MSDKAVGLLKELMEEFMPQTRGMILSDISGRDFTVVLEGEFDSLERWEQQRQEGYQREDFSTWFGRFQELVETSFTEIYKIEYSQM